jgi:site-specific recombinase XerD
MAKRQSIRVFTEQQKKVFMATLRDSKKSWRDYMLFDLLFCTGLRINEATNLNISHVYNGNGCKKTLEIVGKGNKVGCIPLNAHIRDHIEKYVNKKKRMGECVEIDSPLFLSRNKQRITNRAVQYNFRNYLKISGIEDSLTVHSIRHYVGTTIMRKTNNIRKTQEFLRHADINSTQIYTHVTREELNECSEMLD